MFYDGYELGCACVCVCLCMCALNNNIHVEGITWVCCIQDISEESVWHHGGVERRVIGTVVYPRQSAARVGF